MKHSPIALVLIVMSAPPAAAQARFQSGAFAWTPVIVLRDAGHDTNLFEEAQDPKRDTMAIVSPQVDGLLELSRFTLAVSGQLDFAYFRRYTQERSFNKRGSVRVDVPLSHVRPFASLAYLDTRERQNSEVDVRALRAERNVGAGVNLQLATRVAVEVAVGASDLEYREGVTFRGSDLAERLNRTNTTATARLRVAVTPLTRVLVEGDVSRDRFLFRPEQDANHVRVHAGFEFSPDAIISGRATIGYHHLAPQGTEAFGFQGVTASVGIGYVLLGRTRFDVRVVRNTNYSVEEQPYFLLTSYGGEILHNLVGPLDVVGRYTRETLDYPGIAERNILTHVDRIQRFGAGLVVRAASRLRVGFNYEFSDRLSGESVDYSYDRRRAYTTLTYGF